VLRIGDKPLREFAGTLTQLQSVHALHNLMETAGEGQTGALIARPALKEKITEYEVRGVFVANLTTGLPCWPGRFAMTRTLSASKTITS
jgi:hypothetical protein